LKKPKKNLRCGSGVSSFGTISSQFSLQINREIINAYPPRAVRFFHLLKGKDKDVMMLILIWG